MKQKSTIAAYATKSGQTALPVKNGVNCWCKSCQKCSPSNLQTAFLTMPGMCEMWAHVE